MTTLWGGQPTELGSGTHWGRYSIGIPFAQIPTSGLHGPSLMGLDTGIAPTDEVRIYVTTVPPGLTFFECDEDGVTRSEGPAGSHYGTRSSAANGTTYTTPDTDDFVIIFGTLLDGDATSGDLVGSGTLTGGTPSAVTGDALFGDAAASGTISEGLASILSSASVIGDLAGSGSIGVASSMGGDATIDVIVATGVTSGGVASALSGDAVPDVIFSVGTASGGIASDISGAAVPGVITASGSMECVAFSDLSGTATIGDLHCTGSIGSLILGDDSRERFGRHHYGRPGRATFSYGGAGKRIGPRRG